jgi:hypothetical protein
MKKILFIEIIYFLALIVVGWFIFPFWSSIIAVWASIYFYSKLKNLVRELSPSFRKIFLITAFAYPLVESGIKYIVSNDVIENSWVWLNRVEHFGFNIALCILVYPILSNWLKKLDFFGKALLYIGTLTIVGNLNEFMEFFLRLFWDLQENFAHYYPDTMIDLIVNIVGTLCGFLLVYFISRDSGD